MIFFLAYAVGYLLCLPVVSRALMLNMGPMSSGGSGPKAKYATEDYIWSTALGAMLCVFWPLCLIVYGVAMTLKRSAEAEESTEVPPHDTSMW